MAFAPHGAALGGLQSFNRHHSHPQLERGRCLPCHPTHPAPALITLFWDAWGLTEASAQQAFTLHIL